MLFNSFINSPITLVYSQVNPKLPVSALARTSTGAIVAAAGSLALYASISLVLSIADIVPETEVYFLLTHSFSLILSLLLTKSLFNHTVSSTTIILWSTRSLGWKLLLTNAASLFTIFVRARDD